jgi:hypothetical protein
VPNERDVMKVKDLLELLKDKNPEALVIVDGYEGYYDEVNAIKVVKVSERSDVKRWDGHLDYDENGVEAVYLPRESC